MKSTDTTQKSNFIYITLLLLIALLFIPLFTKAQTTTPFVQRYEKQGINGDLTLIGNSNVGESATVPYNGETQNNFIDMVFIDIDNDASTFNSSSANFTTAACNKVVYAGLYWGAVSAPTTPARNEVKFKIPGGAYQDLTADIQLDIIYYKDVTAIVTANTNPNGDYFVANISANTGNHASAGWTLVIVYEDPSLPRKYISTFDGFSAVRDFPNNAVDFSYSGFTTPPSGPVEGRIGVVALEGDLGWVGDQMLLKADANTNFTALFDAESPVNNFFNSKITDNGAHITNRNLNSTNTLGWDQKMLDFTPLNTGNSLIGNNETGVTVRVTNNVGGDHIYTFLNTFSINIIEPVIEVLTSVENTSGNQVTLGSPIQLGETVWYNINFKNIGTDNAINTNIVNTLPINVTLDESSITLPAGVTYTYASATRQLVFTIDNSLVLRESNPNNAAYDIRYQVTASDDCFDYTDACTNLLENFIESNYGGETSGADITAQPGLNGINGCGLGNVGSMDLFVDTSSCNFDSTETFCNNNLTISGHDGYNIYKWVDANGTVLAANSKEITVAGPGVYTCTQTRVGCSITTRVITVLGIDFALTPTDALCKDSENGTIKVDVTDIGTTFTYELSKSGTVVETVSSTTAKTHTFSGLDIGSYTVKVTNNDGCHNTSAPVTISEPTLLQATSKVVDNIMPCNGNALIGRVEATGTGGTSPYTYSIGGAFQNSNIFNVSAEGNHTLTVKDTNGCTTTTTVTIDFDEEIVYDIAKDDVVCIGGSDGKITVNVTQNNAANTLSYSIDGTTFQTSPVFSGLSKGDHTITIRKVKSINTCDIVNTINLIELTDLQFEAIVKPVCETSTSQIVGTVATEYTNEVSYTLDGSFTNTTGIFNNVSDGEHIITVVNTVTGCTSDPITLQVDLSCFGIPNFFTPDGDGINDTWYPKGVEDFPNITVKIFDRYQRLIVNYNGSQHSWDGSYNGKLLPSGDYWYIIKLNEPDDNREFKGNFTLYR